MVGVEREREREKRDSPKPAMAKRETLSRCVFFRLVLSIHRPLPFFFEHASRSAIAPHRESALATARGCEKLAEKLVETQEKGTDGGREGAFSSRFSPFAFCSLAHLIAADDDEALAIFSTGVPALAAVELSEGAAARSLQGAPRTPRAPSVVAMVALEEG